jgi:hypothetical protein
MHPGDLGSTKILHQIQRQVRPNKERGLAASNLLRVLDPKNRAYSQLCSMGTPFVYCSIA